MIEPDEPLLAPLQDVSDQPAGTSFWRAVPDPVVRPVLTAPGGQTTPVLCLQGDGSQVVSTCSPQVAALGLWPARGFHGGPVRPPPSGITAVHTRKRLFLGAAGGRPTAFPDLEAQTGAVAAGAGAVLPMMLLGGRSRGVTALESSQEAIARKTVQWLVGRLWLDSRPGHSTTFQVSLPGATA